MSEKEIIDTGINFTYDDHGHPELGNVSKSHIFNMLTQQELKTLRIKVKSRPNEMGYELRCCRPVAYDLAYATRLGLGVYKLFQRGNTGCMIMIDRNSEVKPLFLKDVEDEKGKVKPRLVDVTSENVQMIFRNNLHYLTKEDYRSAKKYVKDPESYDFYRILEWEE
jgi:6-phosphofructokinase 1